MSAGLKALVGVTSLFLALAAIGFVALIYWRMSGAYGFYRVPTNGMAPTIKQGDMVFGLASDISLSKLHQGQVILFKMIHVAEKPDREGQVFVQRIAAMPGQRVELREGKVMVDGKEFTATNEFGTHHYAAMGNQSRDFTVPAGHVFTLGDNTRNSYDGRYWGCLPVDRIIQRAASRYLPYSRAGAIH